MDSDSSCEPLSENLALLSKSNVGEGSHVGVGAINKAKAVVGRLSRAITYNIPFENENFSVHSSPTSSSLCSEIQDVSSRIEHPEDIARRRMRKAMRKYTERLESLHAEVEALEAKRLNLHEQVERLRNVDRREAHLNSEFRLMEEREAGLKVKEKVLEDKLQLAERSKNEVLKYWETQSSLEARDEKTAAAEKEVERRLGELEKREKRVSEASKHAAEVDRLKAETEKLAREVAEREERVAVREEKVSHFEARLDNVILREKALAQAKVDLEDIARQKALQEELQKQLDADAVALSDKAERLSKREDLVAGRIVHAERLKASLEVAIAETAEESKQNEQKKRELTEWSARLEREEAESRRQSSLVEREKQQFQREMSYRREQWESAKKKEEESLERLKLESVRAHEEAESARREVESRENRIRSREKEVQAFKYNQVSLREEEFKINTQRAELEKESEALRAESSRLEKERKTLEDLRVRASEAQAALEKREKQLKESRCESLELLKFQLDKRTASLDERERSVKGEEGEIEQAKQARQSIRKLKKACEKEMRRAKEEASKSQEAKKNADDMQRSLYELEKGLKEREIRIQAYEQRMEDLERKEDKVSSAQLQQERSSLKIREKEKQLVQKEQLLEQQKEQLEGVEADRRAEWKRQLNALAQSAQSAKLEKEDLKRRWEEVERKEALLASEAEEQRTSRSKTSEERRKVDAMIEELSIQREELTRSKQALERRQSEFNNHVQAWQGEQAALQKEAQEVMQAVRSERADLEREKARVNQEVTLDSSQKQGRVESLDAEAQRLESEVKRLRKAKDLAQETLKQAQRDAESIATRNKKKQEDVAQAESRLLEASSKLDSLRNQSRSESKELQMVKSRIEKIRQYEKEFERRAEEKAAGLSKRQARVRAMETKLQTAAEAVKLRARKVAKRERELADVKQHLQTRLPSQAKSQSQKLEIKLRVPPSSSTGLKSKRPAETRDAVVAVVNEKQTAVVAEGGTKEASCSHEKLMELFEEMNLAQREEFTKLKSDLEQRDDGQKVEQTMHALVEELLEAKALAEEGMMKSAATMREDILQKLREIEHKHEEKYESMEKKWENAWDEIQRSAKTGQSNDDVDVVESTKTTPERVSKPVEPPLQEVIAFVPPDIPEVVQEDIEVKTEEEPVQQPLPGLEVNPIHAPIEQLQTVTPLLAQRSKEARECLALAIVAQENVSFSKIDSILKQVDDLPSSDQTKLSQGHIPDEKQDEDAEKKELAEEKTKEVEAKLEEEKAEEIERKQKLQYEERAIFEKQLMLVHECDTRLQGLVRSLESVKRRMDRLEKILPHRNAGSSMEKLGKACQDAETEFCNARFFVRDTGDRLRSGLKHLDQLVLKRMLEQVELTEKLHVRLEEELQAQILRGHAIVATQGTTTNVQTVEEPPSRDDPNVSVEVMAAANEIACSLQTLEDTIRARDKILERAKDDEISTLTDTDASGLYDTGTNTGMPRISEEIEDDHEEEVQEDLSEKAQASDQEVSVSSSRAATDQESFEDHSYSVEIGDSNAPDEPSLEITHRSESIVSHAEGSFSFVEPGSSHNPKNPVQSIQVGQTSGDGELDSERARKILRLQELSVELALASDEEEAELLQKEFDALQESLGGESFTANLI